jgi:hypothetical protein
MTFMSNESTYKKDMLVTNNVSYIWTKLLSFKNPFLIIAIPLKIMETV